MNNLDPAREMMKADQAVGTIGTRGAYRDGCRFGSNVALKVLGIRRAARRNVLRRLMHTWHAKHLRDQFTLTNPYFSLPPAKLTEIIDHILEEGGTVLLTLFNFTAAALDAWSDDTKLSGVMSNPWVVAGKAIKYELPRAGKLALSLGWACNDPAMMKWCAQHIETQLAPLHKYKGNPRVMFELRNEIDVFTPTAVFGYPEARSYDLEATCRSMGMNPSPQALATSISTLEGIIKGAGYTLYAKVPVHGYINAVQGGQGWRTDSWLLGYLPGMKPGTMDGQEFNAGIELDSTVPGTSQEREVLRCGLDLFARGCDVLYLHTHMLIPSAVPYADTDPFGQFRDPAIALAWAGGKMPSHEGTAVLNPLMAEAYRQLAYVVTLGGE